MLDPNITANFQPAKERSAEAQRMILDNCGGWVPMCVSTQPANCIAFVKSVSRDTILLESGFYANPFAAKSLFVTES